MNNTCKDSTTELLAPSWTGISMRLHAIFEYSANDRSIYSEGNANSENISSTYWGHTCINESISGMCFVYETVGGCLFLCTSPTDEIHDKICFGFFYACSIEWTFEYFPPMYCFLLFIIISSILALSDWFKHGSSFDKNKIYENVQTKNFWLSIRSGHFKESINFTDCRNVIRNEGF